MKSVIVLALLLAGYTATAQVPHRISYQATIRDDMGELVRNSEVGIRIRILRDSLMQIPIYSETHDLNTNRNGLVSLQIGGGAPQFGLLDTIDWGASTFFVETAVDVDGGSDYQILGATQFLAVPYALYALKSGSVEEDVDTTEVSGEHYVGEYWGGGVVFAVWKGADGEQHGLIVSLEDQADSIEMHLNGIDIELEDTEWNGALNTSRIVASATNPINAASVCKDHRGGGYDDWYLPSRQEMKTLFAAAPIVNRTLDTIDAAQTVFTGRIYEPVWPQAPELIYYWSSSLVIHGAGNLTYQQQFHVLRPLVGGAEWSRSNSVDVAIYRVRAIREF